MTCTHKLDPESTSKLLYLSLKFTECWKSFIFNTKLPKHFLVCTKCGQKIGKQKNAHLHTKDTSHSLFIDLMQFSIFCSSCKKRFKAPDEVINAIIMSIPISPIPLCKGGFPNLGYSCYSSSVLMALSACTPLVNAAICSPNPACKLFSAAVFDNRNVNRLIHAFMPMFPPNKMFDAAEFLLIFIDSLCQDPLIHSLFGGITSMTIKCDVCKNKRVIDQPFTILTVPLDDKGWCECHCNSSDTSKARSIGTQDIWEESHEATAGASFVSFMMHGSTEKLKLQNCLESMFSPSLTECNKCHKNSELCVALTSLPEILIIHLARFVKRWFGQGKAFQFVSFPGHDDVDFGHFVPPEVNCGPTVYRIVAIISHVGTLNAGHYVCYAKIGEKWILFDDANAKIISEEDALSTQGYLLFYVRKRSEEVEEIKDSLERTQSFDCGLPLRVIADPQKWVGTVPRNDIPQEIVEKADALAGRSVLRDMVLDDMRAKFINRMPLAANTIPVNKEALDSVWNFLFKKGPMPTIKECDDGEFRIAGTVNIFKQLEQNETKEENVSNN